MAHMDRVYGRAQILRWAQGRDRTRWRADYGALVADKDAAPRVPAVIGLYADQRAWLDAEVERTGVRLAQIVGRLIDEAMPKAGPDERGRRAP